MLFFFRNKITIFAYQIYSLKNVDKVTMYADDLILKNSAADTTYDMKSFSWDNENSSRTWKYYNGFMMKSFLKRGLYPDVVEHFYNDNLSDDGLPNNFRNKKNIYTTNSLDDISTSRTLFLMLNSSNSKKYLKNIKFVYNQILKQDRLPNCGNNFLHKKNNLYWREYVFGLDGLYSALPFLLEYEKYINKSNSPKVYNSVFNSFRWVFENLKNSEGLYNHGVKKDGKTVNNVVWLRAVGWYAMAQKDIIDLFPYGKKKELLKLDLKEFLDAVLKYQDKNTGLWKNVIYPAGDYECNFYETSGSAMISYVLMDSYIRGYVKDKKYAYAGLKAFNGIVKNKLKRNLAGNYVLTGSYRSSSVHDNVEDYCICGNYVIDEAKGVAPLIMASAVVEKTFERLYK